MQTQCLGWDMVTRRQALKGAVSIGSLAALSGCLGYEVVSSSDLDEQDDRISTLERQVTERDERVADLTDRLADRNQTIDTLESDLETARSERDTAQDRAEELENEIATLEADLARTRKGKIYDFYDSANEIALQGDSNYNTGIDEYDSGNYRVAADYFFQAAMFYDASQYLFGRAETFAMEAEFTEASGLAGEAAENVWNWSWVATYYGRASVHYADDEFNDGDADIDEGDTYYNQQQNYQTTAPSAFADTLDYSP